MRDAAAARRVVILGAGGHARVVLATLRTMRAQVAGCLASDRPDSRWPRDIPWLGTDAALAGLDAENIVLANGIGSVANCASRRRVFEAARAAGFGFMTLRHPGALIEADVVLGEGTQVMVGAILQIGVRIGSNAIVNTGAIVDHDGVIGDHAHIAPGAHLSGGVTVGTAVHVGTGAIVIQGITIAGGAVVGAGAVVLSDVPENVRVAGVPASPLAARVNVLP